MNPTPKYDRQTRGGAEMLAAVGSSAANQYFGITNVACGVPGTGVSIPSTIVGSASLIFLTPKALSPASATAFPGFVVGSLVDNVGFCIGVVASVGFTTSYAVMWELKNARQ